MNRRSLLALPALLLAGARRRPGAPGRSPVVASFSILGDMTAQIGGDRIALRVIAGPDVDAHGFQPRPSDVAALRDARAGGAQRPRLRCLDGPAGRAPPASAARSSRRPRASRRAPWRRMRTATTMAAPARRQSHSVGPRTRARPACLAGPAPRPGLCAQHRRRAGRRRPGRRGDLSPQRRGLSPRASPTLDGWVRAQVATRARGAPQGRHQPRRLRLFRRRLWHRVPRAAGRLDRNRSPRPPRSRA